MAAALGAKRAVMADPQRAERATGYVVGGISPLGQKRPHRTVVDETVELWDTVHVSAGRRGLEVEISPADLVRLTGAVSAPVAR
jgi:Cys-tRNA(Pro)/Cys-tRNA(Cys) deacylase